MPSIVTTERRRQFCSRCAQLMFEYFRSPDGHFGLANAPPDNPYDVPPDRCGPNEARCPWCGAQYKLLERTNAMGQAVERK